MPLSRFGDHPPPAHTRRIVSLQPISGPRGPIQIFNHLWSLSGENIRGPAVQAPLHLSDCLPVDDPSSAVHEECNIRV